MYQNRKKATTIITISGRILKRVNRAVGEVCVDKKGGFSVLQALHDCKPCWALGSGRGQRCKHCSEGATNAYFAKNCLSEGATYLNLYLQN